MITPDAVKFAQDHFVRVHRKLTVLNEKFAKSFRNRKILAYGMKAIVVFGGIVLTTGLGETPSKIVGILLTVSVALDSWLSNHKKLMALASATEAGKSTIRLVDHLHVNGTQDFLPLRDDNDGRFGEGMVKMFTALRTRMTEDEERIRSLIAKSDYQALLALAVDRQREEESPGANA